MALSFQTPGYENLELSTQVLIAEALKRDVEVEVIDAQSQFIRLKKGTHVEYVEAATITSRDSYVTSKILGNKVVSKYFLKEQGVRVPEGRNYDNYSAAMEDAEVFLKDGKSYVVKPKTTNFGIGITILKGGFTKRDFSHALTFAFSYDTSVLVEEFIPGMECRFLVIDGKCVAVLQRIPANVKGDGEHTVRELVDKKNDNPLRGKGHMTPLECIEIGEVEVGVLKEQHLNAESVPKKDEIVYLRRNSNISTGGDGIDMTDVVSDDYKKLAEKAATAAGAKICGVDIILGSELNEPAPNDSNHAIIELNFNPVLYFHNFPSAGKNREVGKYVLDLLGF